MADSTPDPREVVIDEAVAARTDDEISVAEASLRDWLVAHPDDFAMRELANLLDRKKGAVPSTTQAAA